MPAFLGYRTEQIRPPTLEGPATVLSPAHQIGHPLPSICFWSSHLPERSKDIRWQRSRAAKRNHELVIEKTGLQMVKLADQLTTLLPIAKETKKSFPPVDFDESFYKCFLVIHSSIRKDNPCRPALLAGELGDDGICPMLYL